MLVTKFGGHRSKHDGARAKRGKSRNCHADVDRKKKEEELELNSDLNLAVRAAVMLSDLDL